GVADEIRRPKPRPRASRRKRTRQGQAHHQEPRRMRADRSWEKGSRAYQNSRPRLERMFQFQRPSWNNPLKRLERPMKQGKVVRVERGTATRKRKDCSNPDGEASGASPRGVEWLRNKCRTRRAEGSRVCDEARPDAAA